VKNMTCVSLLLCAVLVAVTAPAALAQTPAPSLAKEIAATWQRAVGEILDIAEAMPEQKYDFKPTPEMSTFRDQLVHLAGIVQRFVDSAKGTKSEHAHSKTMTKAEVITLLKQTFQSGQDMVSALNDGPQLLEPMKFPFGDRIVTRATFWEGPLYQIRNHYGQLVVYLRLNGIVPPATARRGR
jgi:uncharacterized damage-inducible protein DinB